MDPKYLGIPNINFSVGVDDTEEYKEQRLKRGFDDTELWELDVTIASFIYPRLVEFKEQYDGVPGIIANDFNQSELNKGLHIKKWENILDDIIYSFERVMNSNTNIINSKDMVKVKKGLKLFAEYYFNFWI